MQKWHEYINQQRLGEVHNKHYGQLSNKQQKAVKRLYKSGKFVGTQAAMTSTQRFSRVIVGDSKTNTETHVWVQE